MLRRNKKLNSVTAVERRFASHPNSTNATVGCWFTSMEKVVAYNRFGHQRLRICSLQRLKYSLGNFYFFLNNQK